MTETIPPRTYKRTELEAFDLLPIPIWVFDVEKTAMWWANKAALVVWAADGREELLERDFRSDMSECVRQRCEHSLRRCRMGEVYTEQVSRVDLKLL